MKEQSKQVLSFSTRLFFTSSSQVERLLLKIYHLYLQRQFSQDLGFKYKTLRAIQIHTQYLQQQKFPLKAIFKCFFL